MSTSTKISNEVLSDDRLDEALLIDPDKIFDVLFKGIPEKSAQFFGNKVIMVQHPHNIQTGLFYRYDHKVPSSEWDYLGCITFKVIS